MQSPAPLFSRALFRKNMQRFWPIFAIYTVIFLLVSFSIVTNARYELLADVPDIFAKTIFGFSDFMSPLIALFSIIVAVAVFSYMYNPMSTSMVNALPFNRRTVFISNYLSGLFIIMVPLLLFFLSLIGIGLNYACLDMTALLKWLFIFTSLSLLLYSLAVIIGMFTGNIIAHLAFFGIANFLLIGLEALIKYFLELFLYGYAGTFHYTNWFFMKATPVAYATTMHNANINLHWWVWIVYILVGVVLTWLAHKMYQKRKMENAGDVIAIRQLNPIFKYGVTFCSSLALGSMLMQMFNFRSQSFALAVMLFLLAGLIGYFVAEMLLRKSFRVLKSYKGFIVYACLLVIVSMSVYYDWYGYATRMPDTDKVEAVAFSYSGALYNVPPILQAEQSQVNLDGIPNLPESLARAYGAPVSMKKDPRSNNYVYPDASNLTPEQTKLLWSVFPGIYSENESIDSITKLHHYLVENVKTVRNDYRKLSSTDYYKNENIQRFDISFIYRLDNGKLQKHSFPVILPVKPSAEVDQKILTQLASLAGCQEERAKKAAAIDVPVDNIRRITIDMNMMRYIQNGNANKIFNRAVNSTAMDPREKDLVPVEIRDEDKAAFLQAVKADRQNIGGKQILRQSNCSSCNVSFENPNLPLVNRFRDRDFDYDISVYYEHTFSFLLEKGYITEDIYKFVQQYRELLDAKYSTPLIAKLG